MKFIQVGIVKLFVIGLIGILALSGIGYKMYSDYLYKQSPEYSLKIIYNSIQKGDPDTFFKYVDGEGIIHRIYDPYIEKLLKESDGRNISMVNSKGEKRILNLGEALLFTSLDNYHSDITAVLLDEDLTEKLRFRTGKKDPFIDNLKSLKEADRYELISIEEKNNANGVANLVITALDKKTNETKIFPVEMTQMEDKSWKLTGYDYKKYHHPYDAFDQI
ncbi:MAG: hypothetical protein E6744_01370 [Veillonella sp.]|jgi:hypothetical protein|uniref:hypothetical protein n=1 Tax=Veillonella sp. TaxID=1926307 RepID=UPI00258461AA|nr:hypothetical protein [Veillonella sp.]MDU1973369.1 hypothetical protein [Veillonella sp.]MDU4573195.1 hypothetical protein [Veillonella sp.]